MSSKLYSIMEDHLATLDDAKNEAFNTNKFHSFSHRELDTLVTDLTAFLEEVEETEDIFCNFKTQLKRIMGDAEDMIDDIDSLERYR